MLAAPLQAGVGFYAFYALQPLLLDLWGDPNAYAIAGTAAAVVAGSQIIGGLLAAPVSARVARRTTVLIVSCVGSAVLLVGAGVAGAAGSFWGLLFAAGWALLGAVGTPIQGAYLNGMIPSQQRATVLSFASLMGSGGGVVIQPALGRVADVSGYGTSFLFALGRPARRGRAVHRPQPPRAQPGRHGRRRPRPGGGVPCGHPGLSLDPG